MAKTRQTKQSLTEQVKYLRSQLDITEEALNAVLDYYSRPLLKGAEKPTLPPAFACFSTNDRKELISAELLSPTRAHGGLVLYSHTIVGQPGASRSVFYLEQQADYWRKHLSSEYARGMTRILEQLLIERDKHVCAEVTR